MLEPELDPVERTFGNETTTCAPALSPPVITICPRLVVPVVTTWRAVFPFVETVTYDVPFDWVTAFTGTVNTFTNW